MAPRTGTPRRSTTARNSTTPQPTTRVTRSASQDVTSDLRASNAPPAQAARRSSRAYQHKELPTDVAASYDRTYGGNGLAATGEDISRRNQASLTNALADAVHDDTSDVGALSLDQQEPAPTFSRSRRLIAEAIAEEDETENTSNLADQQFARTGGSQSHVVLNSGPAVRPRHSLSPRASNSVASLFPWKQALLFLFIALGFSPLFGLGFNVGRQISVRFATPSPVDPVAEHAVPVASQPAQVPLPAHKDPMVLRLAARVETLAASLGFDAYHRVFGPNYFSPSLGANVISSLSSPTQSSFPAAKGGFFSNLFTRLSPNHNPHIAALTPWSEAGDCWCAAASSKGGAPKAQLAVSMAFDVIPQTIVIEHVPALAAPSVDSAPRVVEAWVPIRDDERRARFLDWVQFRRDDQTKTFLPDEYVRIGQWTMDPYKQREYEHELHVDTAYVNAAKEAAAVNEVVLRVTANHGAPFTCIYRAKLYGKPINVGQQDFGW